MAVDGGLARGQAQKHFNDTIRDAIIVAWDK